MFSERLGLDLGSMNQLGALRHMPKLFLHTTKNTYVPCPVCRATKCNVIMHDDYTATYQHCTRCQGTGIIFKSD